MKLWPVVSVTPVHLCAAVGVALLFMLVTLNAQVDAHSVLLPVDAVQLTKKILSFHDGTFKTMNLLFMKEV